MIGHRRLSATGGREAALHNPLGELIVALVDGLWAYQGSLIFFMGPLGTKIRQI